MREDTVERSAVSSSLRVQQTLEALDIFQAVAVLVALGGVAAAWPRVARAQQGERMRRIGVLRSSDAGDPKGKVQLFAFMEDFAPLGWADGPNLRMEIRWGGGNVNRASVFAK